MNRIPTVNDKFFFYGSLRKGDYNHMNKEPETFATLRGYKMYSLGAYPFITETNDENDTILGEIYSDLKPSTIEHIDNMELGAGYKRELVEVVDEQNKKHEVVVYTMIADDDWTKKLESVEDGDWLVFKRKKQNRNLEDF